VELSREKVPGGNPVTRDWQSGLIRGRSGPRHAGPVLITTRTRQFCHRTIQTGAQARTAVASRTLPSGICFSEPGNLPAAMAEYDRRSDSIRDLRTVLSGRQYPARRASWPTRKGLFRKGVGLRPEAGADTTTAGARVAAKGDLAGAEAELKRVIELRLLMSRPITRLPGYISSSAGKMRRRVNSRLSLRFMLSKRGAVRASPVAGSLRVRTAVMTRILIGGSTAG